MDGLKTIESAPEKKPTKSTQNVQSNDAQLNHNSNTKAPIAIDNTADYETGDALDLQWNEGTIDKMPQTTQGNSMIFYF